MLQDRLDDVGVVVDAELIGHGQQQRVGLGDGLVLLQLLDQHVRLGGVAAAEDGACVVAEEADLVPLLVAAPPKYMRSRSSTSAKMLRLTDTRGVRACPAAFHAAR